jgi:hypothetical protein
VELEESLGDLRQLANVRPFEFTDGLERGTRAVSIRNAAGLAFRVLLEWGMSLNDLQFWGVPIPFLSAAEHASGRLQFLQPGEVWCYAIEVVFFEPGRAAR